MLTHSLQAKFIWPVSLLVVVVTLTLVAAISLRNSRSIELSAQTASRENLASVGQLLSVTDAILMERVKGSMRLLLERGQALGPARRGPLVQVDGRQVPDILLGGHAQAFHFGLVDGVTASQGGTATLFSRDGDQFVRISTNVRKDGKRAVGTLLDPHGQAIRSIWEGRPFYGQVDILGTPFLTAYEPMRDASGEIIGIWYVGYPVHLQALRESIARSRILTRGFIVLLDGKGAVRFHSGNVTPEVAASVTEGTARGWVISKESFAPWGFQMVAAYPNDEVLHIVRQEVFAVAMFGLAFGSLLIGLLIWLARSLVIAPLREVVAVAEAIAQGNLTDPIASRRKDEIGVLLAALNHMRISLLQMIDKITAHAESIGKLKDTAIQHLRKQDQLKSGFLSSVSHELRTPLTSIRGFAHLVEREFSRSFAPLAAHDPTLEKKAGRIRENLDVILKESDRLTRLINDVLDLAKIEAGRVDWRDVTVDVGRLVRDASKAAQGAFNLNPHVELLVDVQEGLPTLIGDVDRLLQVLVNLLNNAGKFTVEGQVVISARLAEDECIRIEVRDTGIGFPPEDAESIFDKFQQARQGDTLVDRPKGTGLGLAIAREIVERHGGKIWATSQPGSGSVFTISLPVKTPPTAANIAAQECPLPLPPAHYNRTPPQRSDATRPRVLVVDDDPAVREYLSQLLQEHDYEVLAVADGQASVRAAQDFLPHLITMDLAMPGMDGRTAIARLRADPRTRRIPVMVLSALPDLDSAGGTISMGKPLNEKAFLKNIECLLGRAAIAEQKQMRFLVLYDKQRDKTVQPNNLPTLCEWDYCPLEELEQRIQSDFDGVLLIPSDLLDKIDVHKLQSFSSLKTMVVPA
ncbi:Cache 3/Cache 2 fusion domain-containing protein [Candidatus Symbiobacter mobilis]|uniref:histidine kinase n=1 Tax=Candidatus Symbiobacter mobilis CR TaxID=946483 RepID=U5N966_9BURK|nr:Cache 3/Cache 2 fusion domain-containing protein [Candidatus Symbiobacter mobilis]AGX88106.1 signal transduction histidine kinase [Candidatus Symbiobacter mobilis CR]